jgi:hypothetical protein
MKVYVVDECGYEGVEFVVGIFSTKELALEAKRQHDKFLDEDHAERIEQYKQDHPKRPTPSYLESRTTEVYITIYEVDEIRKGEREKKQH